MKAIKGLAELQHVLATEDSRWQQMIYEKTGVIVLFSHQNVILFSNCGYIDLDYDAEYSYISGVDSTIYCEINSIKDMISYVLAMDSYHEYLVDESFGHFSKAELFWAIYERILLQEENLKHSDGTHEQEWGLLSIHRYKEHVELKMALIACDNADIWLDISEQTTIDEVLISLVAELNKETEYQDWLPIQRVFEASFSVPRNYDTLMSKHLLVVHSHG